MKKKVSELEGAELDYWVAKAEGRFFEKWDDTVYSWINDCCISEGDYFNPHENWSIAGPIIEREKIKLQPLYDQKRRFYGWEAKALQYVLPMEGPTPLIAAMRSYVAHNIGDEVEI